MSIMITAYHGCNNGIIISRITRTRRGCALYTGVHCTWQNTVNKILNFGTAGKRQPGAHAFIAVFQTLQELTHFIQLQSLPETGRGRQHFPTYFMRSALSHKIQRLVSPMTRAAKILKHTQQYIKIITHCNQVGFIPGMQDRLNV